MSDVGPRKWPELLRSGTRRCSTTDTFHWAYQNEWIPFIESTVSKVSPFHSPFSCGNLHLLLLSVAAKWHCSRSLPYNKGFENALKITTRNDYWLVFCFIGLASKEPHETDTRFLCALAGNSFFLFKLGLVVRISFHITGRAF